uniref:Uncharacterized protein n=1 Tax=Megaselia scalaris TaxID=36166 RepID=T1H284_MEGSC
MNQIDIAKKLIKLCQMIFEVPFVPETIFVPLVSPRYSRFLLGFDARFSYSSRCFEQFSFTKN